MVYQVYFIQVDGVQDMMRHVRTENSVTLSCQYCCIDDCREKEKNKRNHCTKPDMHITHDCKMCSGK